MNWKLEQNFTAQLKSPPLQSKETASTPPQYCMCPYCLLDEDRAPLPCTASLLLRIAASKRANTKGKGKGKGKWITKRPDKRRKRAVSSDGEGDY